MSEVFEALLKAQREADARLAGSSESPPPASVSDNGHASGANLLAPAGAETPRSRRRPLGWLPWIRRGSGRNGHGKGTPWIITPQDRTVMAEQFRVLRTRIETVGPSTFMITSALDQEGKTLCAVNIAIALAMGVGGGAVLVDADLRRPSAGLHFRGHGRPGLLDCLTGEARWQDCLMPTSHKGLKVLPAGKYTTMAAELLGSDRMGSIVAEMRAEFPQHYILLDTPPILLAADPMVVARHVSHVVLVVRAGVTPRRAVSKAIEALGADRFLGVILNDATEHVSDYYHYGGRYSYAGRTPADE